MAHAAQRDDDFLGLDASMRRPLIVSGLFHLMIFLATVIGIPYIVKPIDHTPTPISVEIVNIDKLTQTNQLSKPTPKPDEVKPPPKPVMPTPPKMDAANAPDLTKPTTPLDAATPDESKVPPPPDQTKKPDQKLLKPPPKKPPVQTLDKKPAKPQQDFSSLLKNLVDTPQGDSTDKVKNPTAKPAPDAPIANHMTMSEQDALIRQLGQCWSVLSGAKMAEDMVVDVRIAVNPDRTLQQATIVDQLRYNTDSVFRAAADAAMRALRNPRCTPLELPPDKYEEWKDTVLTFNPKDMLQ